MARNRIAYVELPTANIGTLRTFYREHFGWQFLELGDDYAVFQNSGIDGGINPNANDRTQAPLVLIETDEVDALQERLRAAGTTITKSAFDYPGGRRFHFLDPDGNELGAFQNVAGNTDDTP